MTFLERQKHYPISLKSPSGKIVGMKNCNRTFESSDRQEIIRIEREMIAEYAATSDGTNNYDS